MSKALFEATRPDARLSIAFELERLLAPNYDHAAALLAPLE